MPTPWHDRNAARTAAVHQVHRLRDPSLAAHGALGFLAGIVAGEHYLGLSFLLHRDAPWIVAPPSGFTAWVVVRSIALCALLFAAAGALLAVVIAGLRRVTGRAAGAVFGPVLGTLLAATLLVELTAWWQLGELAGLPWDDPERRTGLVRHAVIALAAGLAAAVGLARLERRRFAARQGRRFGIWAVVAGLAGVVVVAASDLALRPGPAELDRRTEGSRVVVVDLDGLSWRVLAPLLSRGELPTFGRLVREGAWGTLLTYGAAASPQVWTTVATGKKVTDHGIDDFVTVRGPGYRAEPMQSFDRRARTVWDIAGDYGRRVGVVNWMLTSPPEEVNGYLVARLSLEASGETFPPELADELRQLPAPQNSASEPELRAGLDDIDRAFAVARELLARESLDLVAVYSHASDAAGHRFWRYYQPEAFDPALWRIDAGDLARLDEAIPEIYRRLDLRLGELQDLLGDDTLLIVVSDHGQRASERPHVRFRLDRLLAELGWLQLAPGGKNDEVVYARSRAYPRVATPWTPYFDVNLNLRGREPAGTCDPRLAADLLATLAADLRAVRFLDGTPLFGRVASGADLEAEGEASRGADLVVAQSRFTRDPRHRDRLLRAGRRTLPLSELIELDVEISGTHDHQGVISLHGPGVRSGPLGQRSVTTALQRLIHHLTDRIDAVDALLGPLRSLGLIERASTLDIGPTILYGLGLPIGRDMAGRPLLEAFDGADRPQWIDSHEGRGRRPKREGESPPDEELMDRLRALGYVG